MNANKTETIIKIQLPLKRIPAPKRDKFFQCLPRSTRWLGWLFGWRGGSRAEFGGSRINSTRHFQLFRWHLFTVKKNEYHDRSDKERADEYLRKWSECERELKGLRLLQMGYENTDPKLRKLLKDAIGLDIGEGTIK
jgi:hypothetical protein